MIYRYFMNRDDGEFKNLVWTKCQIHGELENKANRVPSMFLLIRIKLQNMFEKSNLKNP